MTDENPDTEPGSPPSPTVSPHARPDPSTPRDFKTVGGTELAEPFCTATMAANRANRRHSAAPGEFRPAFLNVPHRSVNRKVQGSNPCSGGNLMCKFG